MRKRGASPVQPISFAVFTGTFTRARSALGAARLDGVAVFTGTFTRARSMSSSGVRNRF